MHRTIAPHLPALRTGLDFMTGAGLRRLIRHLVAGKPVLLNGYVWCEDYGCPQFTGLTAREQEQARASLLDFITIYRRKCKRFVLNPEGEGWSYVEALKDSNPGEVLDVARAILKERRKR